MGNTQLKPQPNWSEIFDEIRQKESLTSDAKLAASLGVTRGYICSVRKGRKVVSLELASMMFSRLGRTFDTESIERLFVPTKILKHTSNLKTLRDFAISRADDHCQLCGLQAPFNFPDGRPYLEIHHVIPFHSGGDNSANNIVALCPNCQRKLAVSPIESDVKKLELLTKRYQKQEPN